MLEQNAELKHIKMQRRSQKFKDISRIFSDLGHMAPPFV